MKSLSKKLAKLLYNICYYNYWTWLFTCVFIMIPVIHGLYLFAMIMSLYEAITDTIKDYKREAKNLRLTKSQFSETKKNLDHKYK